jgi:hypothetical protein
LLSRTLLNKKAISSSRLVGTGVAGSRHGSIDAGKSSGGPKQPQKLSGSSSATRLTKI